MKKCAICGKVFSGSDFYPFCSMRCKNVDLCRWFNEAYVVKSIQSEKKSQGAEDFSGQPTDYDV